MTTVTMRSPGDLWGLELHLAGIGDTVPINLLSDSLNLEYGAQDSTLTIGFLDLEGIHSIPAGEHAVVRIPGHYHVTSALASDMNHHAIIARIESEEIPVLPTSYSLSQSFPNPFNPVTQISFALPKACEVKLEFFNAMGQRVATLFEGSRGAGTHTVTWDGSYAASGIYLYRLTAGTYTDTKKMLLLK